MYKFLMIFVLLPITSGNTNEQGDKYPSFMTNAFEQEELNQVKIKDIDLNSVKVFNIEQRSKMIRI